MKITVFCVTRNKSIYVTTLHALLQLTAKTFQMGHQISIQFVTDMSDLANHLKSNERIVWFSYGSSLDVNSFERLFDKCEVMVFPAVTEGVHWDKFKDRRLSEPIHQAGLEFDTVVNKKVSDGIWTVEETCPSIWVADCKIIDKLRVRKGEGVKLPNTTSEVFKRFKDCQVSIRAYTKADVIMHYSHECIGSLLEVAGVSCQKVD